MLQYDKPITICSAGSRSAARWPAQLMYLSELYDKLRTPARGAETLEQYLSLPRAQQDALKDVGGFVAGKLRDGRRKAANVEGRDVLALDLDHIPPGGTDDVLRRVESLGCGYCVYSTRKHAPATPRLRVLIPTDRTVTADEYGPIARKAAQLIGIELCDPSTFEASRLMYWPSCCAGSVYVYVIGDKPFLSAGGVLGMYQDWRDCTQWPQVPGAVQLPKLAAKQGDPEGKAGIVGAFCRVYDVPAAVAAYLPGSYEPVDGTADRLTYAAGSTAGGAVLYDGGKFLFSHHATDPAGGRLCNAFDLVRLHLYGDMDDDARPGTPVNKLPSFTAMRERAAADEKVRRLMDKERLGQASAEFSGILAEAAADEAAGWMAGLSRSQNGAVDCTIDNVWLILENDPNLRGRFAYNEFASRGEVFGALPWDKKTGRRAWADSDNDGTYWYFEKVYHMTKATKIDSALSLHSQRHAFNEVRDYLLSLHWDGVPRLDTLFIDYLGAADTPYTRAAARKAFTAAVARAMDPGCKFDVMTVISGPQGIGKSTLLRTMSRGWFVDSIHDFTGKEASELVQGVWIVEIGELEALRRTDINQVKQFLSQQTDRYRAAYARHVKDCPRRCVFFGTSNNNEYLRDRTGNRRFWPIDAGVQQPSKSVFKQLPCEVDQLWGEALLYWQMGEGLFLPPEVEALAKQEQEDHREHSPREGIIREFVGRKVPADWSKWPLAQRRVYWAGGVQGGAPATVPRKRVCALEVWCEALDGEPKHMKYSDAAEINSVIAGMDGWKKTKNGARYGYCGLQKGFIREAGKPLLSPLLSPLL